jgi:hypothetical protein
MFKPVDYDEGEENQSNIYREAPLCSWGTDYKTCETQAPFPSHLIEEYYGDRRTDSQDEMFACTTNLI